MSLLSLINGSSFQGWTCEFIAYKDIMQKPYHFLQNKYYRAKTAKMIRLIELYVYIWNIGGCTKLDVLAWELFRQEVLARNLSYGFKTKIKSHLT